jgi:hypothetical protein
MFGVYASLRDFSAYKECCHYDRSFYGRSAKDLTCPSDFGNIDFKESLFF